MAKNISNSRLEEIYGAALEAGATGGKISGAGGGGFMTFYCPDTTRYQVIEALELFGGRVRNYSFYPEGMTSWNA
jgi:D-glycero-alpha-D-manno-heptose-7-phosphate kinase